MCVHPELSGVFFAEFIQKLRQRLRQRNEVTIECNVLTFVVSRIGFHRSSAAGYLRHIGRQVEV